MDINSLNYRYPSRRVVVYGKNGMIATSQPLAAQAGLEILKAGGNAIDAAIATAACLTVVEPTSNGIGGDAFSIVWNKGKIYGLNSSGPAPSTLSIEEVKKRGYMEMPLYGFLPVTVPGVPYAWKELSERFGKLSLKETLKPAISYAMEGFPISPVVSTNWEIAFNNYKNKLKGKEYEYLYTTFTVDGRVPKAGEVWRNKDLGKTLIDLGQSNGLSFYEGDIAEKIDKFSKQFNGYIRKEDLSHFKPEWVMPIKVNYRGYDIWELPPNTHGLVVLLALNILNNFDLSIDNLESHHKIIEAVKLAYVDGIKYITDKNNMTINIDNILSREYSKKRSELIKDTAITPSSGNPNLGGTVYLAVADKEGNMISYIQSNFMGFGSGLVVPGTGISLHNRGCTFSLDSNAANCLEPGKRTYHTIIPGFISRNNSPVGPFGVMGAYMQPQGHIQVLTNLIDFKHNPQEALDRPRWQWIDGKEILVESNFNPKLFEDLKNRGHIIQYSDDVASFGRGQIILKNKDSYIGASEPRADGYIAAW